MVASLDKKKYRVENGVFAVEGTKAVRDTWDYFSCRMIIATKQWYDSFGHSGHLGKIMFASKAQLERMSHFSTASDVIAIYDLPQYEINSQEISSGLTIALDNIQDPGNLGTIIRIADWFGIENVFCSNDTVDVYNPKVVQATMGAISRVNVRYGSLPQLFQKYPHLPVYATMLDGSNLYDADLQNRGFIVMGNEGKGISEEVAGFANKKMLIPSFPKGAVTSESLNVGMATAVVVAEFRRRII